MSHDAERRSIFGQPKTTVWFIYSAILTLINYVHNKALRHVENLFIQRFLFIHPRFVFIVQGSLLVVQ